MMYAVACIILWDNCLDHLYLKQRIPWQVNLMIKPLLVMINSFNTNMAPKLISNRSLMHCSGSKWHFHVMYFFSWSQIQVHRCLFWIDRSRTTYWLALVRIIYHTLYQIWITFSNIERMCQWDSSVGCVEFNSCQYVYCYSIQNWLVFDRNDFIRLDFALYERLFITFIFINFPAGMQLFDSGYYVRNAFRDLIVNAPEVWKLRQ